MSTERRGPARQKIAMTDRKPGRNDPCPCGSGEKYKRCCSGKADEQSRSLTKWVAIAVGILSVLGVVGIVASGFTSSEPDEGPRRVWSPEHGHWHNLR